MGCGISMVKYILFLFNFLCAICGILMIVAGSMLFSDISTVNELSEAIKVQQIPITLIALGCVITIIAFFGCCGALRESYCMSMTYACFLFVLMVAQLALVVYVWIYKEDYVNNMGQVVDKAWSRRTQKADYMDALQIGFHCCGKNDYRDYTYQGFFPTTCCDDKNNCNSETVYKQGCKMAFRNFWDKNSDMIKYVGLIIAAIEFVGFVFSCCLANSILNYKRRSAY
ncbi:23 kDa integral membrane protein-like [Eupeodes corollae]|uniref:23 kDa integral membrane protein-like n=1 Tax=Eupeodes corollae TaxID=290404 RepID=UPI002490F4C7|nr:23 kDa integral membrane protein-like [Eupeodes corollae]